MQECVYGILSQVLIRAYYMACGKEDKIIRCLNEM